MRNFFFLGLLICVVQLMNAQSPRVQVIHNSPDPAAATVDIWVNGTKAIDDIPFREATAFLTLNSGTTNVGIAPSTSTAITDTIANFTYNLMMNTDYVIVANGTLSSAGYSPFKAFGLDVYAGARSAANNSNEIDVLVHHGSEDAPTVDVRGQDPTAVVVDNAPFGAFAGYVSLSNEDAIIRITDETGSTIVASYQAPVQTLGLAGNAITVLASGFLDPASNNSGPAFGLYVALPTGGPLVALPAAAAPRVQVIHNSPDAAAGTVDIWVNGANAIDDLGFREATPFVSLTSGANNIGIATSTSTAITDTIANFTFELLDGNTYIVVADGTLSGTGYSPFQAFDLKVYGMGREAANASDKVDVLVHHGSTDAPTVDVRAEDTTTVLVDNAPYGAFAGYLELDTLDYVIRITDETGGTVVASYVAPLDALNLGGNAITVVASGFLDPSQNNNGAAFGLYVALASGGALVELPLATPSSIANTAALLNEVAVYPNPADNSSALSFSLKETTDLTISYYNLQGQLVKTNNVGLLAEGQHNLSLQTADLSNGMYTVLLQTEKSIQAVKLQVQH